MEHLRRLVFNASAEKAVELSIYLIMQLSSLFA